MSLTSMANFASLIDLGSKARAMGNMLIAEMEN